jgi:hypothetical protein
MRRQAALGVVCQVPEAQHLHRDTLVVEQCALPPVQRPDRCQARRCQPELRSQPASTARPGLRRSISGGRRTAPARPHDQRDIVALVPRRPPNVNVTMPGRPARCQEKADEREPPSPVRPRQHRAESAGRLHVQRSFRQEQPVNRLQRQRRTAHPLPRRDCSTRIPRANCLASFSAPHATGAPCPLPTPAAARRSGGSWPWSLVRGALLPPATALA